MGRRPDPVGDPDRWVSLLDSLETDDIPGQTLESAYALHLALFRDIVPNPFDPVAFHPAWRTRDVVGLCQAMTASGDFAAMPILADALQDAGCDDERVLGHCRGDGPHARGCWVVDALLGHEAFPAGDAG